MINRLTWKKLVILGVLLATPFALAQCGSGGESVASTTVGPVGPTYPSEYYFKATVTPHTIEKNGTVALVVSVSDGKGYPASGVLVNVVGPDSTDIKGPTTTPAAGQPKPKAGAGSTGLNGIIQFTLTVTGGEGGIIPLTVAVESSVLTIPVQIKAVATKG